MAENTQMDRIIPAKTVFLWFTPRSLSTAFEKCVASMDGSEIWHEPCNACYVNSILSNKEDIETFPCLPVWVKRVEKIMIQIPETGHNFNGGNLTPGEQFKYDWLKDRLEKPLDEGATFRFIKDTACSIDGRYDKLPKIPTKHTFILRHPNRIALSLRRLLVHALEHDGDPDDFDLGSGHPLAPWKKLSLDPLYNLWKYVRENIDPSPVVIDADDLQTHPEKILRKYCEAVEVPFKESYLEWDGSDEIVKSYHGQLEQTIWGREEPCYDAAFLSSSFHPLHSEIPETVPEKCKGYVENIMEGYRVMYETRIRPE